MYLKIPTFLIVFTNFLLPTSFASLFCPYSAYPSADSEFEELRVEVQAQDDPIQLGQPIYRLKRGGDSDGQHRIGRRRRGDGKGEEISSGGGGGGGWRRIPGEQPFRLFTSAKSAECPKRGCLHELALAEPRVPGTLFYHTDTIMGKLIPPGFLTVDANPRLYCAIVRDDCGASVPIYRHFKMVGPRVYYAYSTVPQVEIGANFTRESMPMCFGWSAQRPPSSAASLPASGALTLAVKKQREEAAAIERLLKNSGGGGADGGGKSAEEEEEEKGGKLGQESGDGLVGPQQQCAAVDPTMAEEQFDAGNGTSKNGEMTEAIINEGIVVNGFALLSAYDNHKLGTLRDHLYTSRKQPEDGEYKKQADLGLVLVDPEAQSNCSRQCLLKVGQMLANRSSDGLGIFPLRDHKLMLMGKESADTYYSPTGETFYCAKRAGQCGANVAIRRYWHLIEMDTLLTVNNSSALAVPVFSIPTWDGVFCYIWSLPSKA